MRVLQANTFAKQKFHSNPNKSKYVQLMEASRGPSMIGLTAVVMSLTALLSCAVEAAATLDEALRGGKATLDVRYRYEYVDQNNALKNAEASTVRSRLGYGTAAYRSLSGYLEFENVTAVGAENYNSGANGKAAYSVVTDPEGSEVNQVHVAWDALSATKVKYGRQRIEFDNQRFIGCGGGQGWRQNEQTFDALSVVNKALPGTSVSYAHLSNVNRVTGANAEMKSDLLNVSYAGLTAGILTGYTYLLDYTKSAGQSTQTLGLRFSGAAKVGDGGKVLYTAEFAQQGDYAENPAAYTVNYYLAEVGGTMRGVTAKLGYEALQGDGAHSVQTPLATLHAFNGWADQFLVTPVNGLQDAYLSVDGAAAGVNLTAVYHGFYSYRGGAEYGAELNLQAMKKIANNYALIAKYASYNAGAAPGIVDTDKMWLVGQLSF
jgi:hypothetical protein